MRTIIRRVGRLENRFIPGDVQGPSPAQILRERRRRLLAVAGLPFDAQPPKPQMYAGARRLTNCRRTAELPRPAPLKWAFYQSGKLPIFVDIAREMDDACAIAHCTITLLGHHLARTAAMCWLAAARFVRGHGLRLGKPQSADATNDGQHAERAEDDGCPSVLQTRTRQDYRKNRLIPKANSDAQRRQPARAPRPPNTHGPSKSDKAGSALPTTLNVQKCLQSLRLRSAPITHQRQSRSE